MTIKTELGKGTTISISLPIRQRVTRLEIPLSDEDTVEPMTILLVDDEPVVREVIAALLTSEGRPNRGTRDWKRFSVRHMIWS